VEKIMIIGVTGSMGCGKSFACKKMVELGKQKNIDISYFDFDDLRRLNNKKSGKNLIEKLKSDLFLFEWALLVEDEMLDLVDRVLLITADYETQLNRLRGGDLPDEEVLRRINIQLTNEQKRDAIVNYGKSRKIEFYSLDTSKNPSDSIYLDLLNKISGR
jgi:dephospho-CoA kinase